METDLEPLVGDAAIIARLAFPPHLRSLLIACRGEIVFEAYSAGSGAQEPRFFGSVAKSFLSALAGAALLDGRLTSLDRLLVDFLPGGMPKGADPRLPFITLRHLISMTSGLEYGGPPEVVDAWLSSPSWLDLALRLPVTAMPGARFSYQPDARLLAWALRQAVGEPLATYARHRLFDPLEIDQVDWPVEDGLDGITICPRDALKLGDLFRQDGVWQGHRLLQSGYAAEATRVTSTGGPPERAAYGYGWWVAPDGFFAAGFGGQYIYVLPDRDMVVVITSTLVRAHPETRELVQRCAQIFIDQNPCMQTGKPD